MKFKEKLACREIAGELYIVDIQAETLHSFNGTGTFLWGCLKKGLAPAAAAAALAEEYEVPPAQAAADTEDFIGTLERRGLLLK